MWTYSYQKTVSNILGPIDRGNKGVKNKPHPIPHPTSSKTFLQIRNCHENRNSFFDNFEIRNLYLCFHDFLCQRMMHHYIFFSEISFYPYRTNLYDLNKMNSVAYHFVQNNLKNKILNLKIRFRELFFAGHWFDWETIKYSIKFSRKIVL